jgi:type VI secretion system protein ImpE
VKNEVFSSREPTMSETKSAQECWRTGDLAGAIAAATREVQSRPGDAAPRTFLFELLCFAGQWDRAEKQLDALAVQDATQASAFELYKLLIKAERARLAFFDQGQPPKFLLDAPDYVRLHLAAAECLGRERGADALALLEQSWEARPELAGELNGAAFTGLRDADDLLAPVLEAYLPGSYLWVPWEHVKELSSDPPAAPRDLLWLPARLTLTDGNTLACYLPALYVRSAAQADDRVKLGRLTEWHEPAAGPVTGLGQHTLAAGESMVGLLECRSLRIT